MASENTSSARLSWTTDHRTDKLKIQRTLSVSSNINTSDTQVPTVTSDLWQTQWLFQAKWDFLIQGPHKFRHMSGTRRYLIH